MLSTDCPKVHSVSALLEILVVLISTSRGLRIRDRRDCLRTTRHVDLPDGLDGQTKQDYQADRHGSGAAFETHQSCAPSVRQGRQTQSQDLVTWTLFAQDAVHNCLLLLVHEHEPSYETDQCSPCHTLKHVGSLNKTLC
jgi:hypothetical protein